jgi:hypothetical protein
MALVFDCEVDTISVKSRSQVSTVRSSAHALAKTASFRAGAPVEDAHYRMTFRSRISPVSRVAIAASSGSARSSAASSPRPSSAQVRACLR